MPRFRDVGQKAEDCAGDYLAALGYTVIARNYRAARSEIDLIAMDGDVLVFVEVRSRRAACWESPEESVDAGKQRRLWEAAETYMAKVAQREMPCRFDVIAIRDGEVRHYVDAFRPTS